MILGASKGVIIGFGIFIMLMGCVMLFKPKRARATLRKAGSTGFINYAEITIRMLPAIALMLYADHCKVPVVFTILGWVMLITSLVLYFIPRKVHHGFSMKSADLLKPFYFQLISPLAFLFGALIIYNVL